MPGEKVLFDELGKKTIDLKMKKKMKRVPCNRKFSSEFEMKPLRIESNDLSLIQNHRYLGEIFRCF